MVTLQQRLAYFISGKKFVFFITFGPLAIYAGIFWVFPLIFTFTASFTDWSPIYPGSGFIGWDNYKKIILDIEEIRPVVNALYFSLGSVPTKVILGLIIALILSSIRHIRLVFRTVYFIPVITPMLVVAIIWKWLYQPDFGLLNQILEPIRATLGLPFSRITWLHDVHLAMPSIIIMDIWKGVGYAVILYLAGIQGIPRAYFEAARVDGAKWWQEILYITIPLLGPTTLFVLIIGTIGAMQIFVPIYIMTQGGPVGATETVVYNIYFEAFLRFRFGYASAMAMILLGIILIISLIQIKLLHSQWKY